ncbi:MAG: polysaccharide export protein [Verrucomicrobiales bacterium]|nr:polysaccharide export protein [Verrucomicrobiales bacterium]
MSIDSHCAWPRGIKPWVQALALILGLGWARLSGVAVAQSLDSYRIQPTDILVVEVVSEPQLGAKEFRVSSGGEISYPFIGAVKAAGRTTTEVQKEIKDLLEADYLVNAQVMVQVREFRKQQVAVLGQVNRPGLVNIPPERKMTVLEAISEAGGPTRLARTSDIQLTRQSLAEPMKLSLEELRKPDHVVHVEPGDVIFLPESRL